MQNNRGVMTLPEMVRHSAAKFERRPALIAKGSRGDRVITFGELGSKVESLARGLIAYGLKKNANCGILGANSPEWAIAYLAVTSAGGICVPIDSQLGENEILHLMADAKVDMSFVAPEFLDCVLDATKGFPKPKQVIALTLDTSGLTGDAIPFEELIRKGQQAQDPLPHTVPDDVAAIIYTSGTTTGNPKGVTLTHGNIVSDITACDHALEFKQEHFLSILPMVHSFECTAGFLLPIYSGCTITFGRGLKSRSILEDLKASRATVIFGCPFLFQKMLDEIQGAIRSVPAAEKATHILLKAVKVCEKLGIKNVGTPFFKDVREVVGLDSLRFLVAGGAPLMPKIPREFRFLGIKMLHGYGLAEASPVLTLTVDEPMDESIGTLLSGVEVRILEPDETGVGELAFKGPMIMKGYYKAPEATQEVLDSDGWLKTGDLGYQDEKGYLYICGRAKNIIVTPAGKNIYPEEIENGINQSPYVLESMAYGHKTESGQEVRAVIVPDYESIGVHSHGRHLSDQDVHKLMSKIVKMANKTLAPFKRVMSFTLMDEELPKTSTNKIKRHLFKEPHVAK